MSKDCTKSRGKANKNHDYDAHDVQPDNQSDKDMKASQNEEGDSVVESAIKIIEESNAEIFLDQFNEAYAFFRGSNKIMGLSSSDFKDWALLEVYKKTGKTPGKDTLESAIRVVRAKAREKGNCHHLFVRVAKDSNGDYWYDLSETKAVKINKNGWSMVTNPPKLFKRFKSQAPQVDPVGGGNLTELIDLLNLSSEDDEILLQVYLVSCFIYGFPHPILVVFGQHGSAKTTLCRFLKSLIDPSSVGTLSPINNLKEFIQAISHNWAAYFDNFSRLKTNLSDALCRVCTGDGFFKRKLYSDDDDIIYSFQHCVGVNGIHNIASRSDLLDRSLLIELSRIPEHLRKTDAEVQKKFNAMKPEILGACFDAAAKAIKILPTVKIAQLPRMADFALWGYAIAEALGIGGKRFMTAYNNNIIRQNKEAIDANPVAKAIVILMDGHPVGREEGTPDYIYQKLIRNAVNAAVDYTRDKSWPTNTKWFGRKLNESIPNLEKVGIKISRSKSDERMIVVEMIRHTNAISSFVGNASLIFDCTRSSVKNPCQDTGCNDSEEQARRVERGEINVEDMQF